MVTENSSQSKIIARLIYSLAGIVHQSGYVDNLRPAQWAALRFFNEVNPESATVKAFARHHASTAGTASRTISALVDKSLLVRVDHPSDSRSHRLALTEKGIDALNNDPIRILEAAAAKLDAPTRAQLTAGLRQIGLDLSSND